MELNNDFLSFLYCVDLLVQGTFTRAYRGNREKKVFKHFHKIIRKCSTKWSTKMIGLALTPCKNIAVYFADYAFPLL